MSNTKQLEPFIFQLSQTVQLEINAKVDMDGMDIHLDRVKDALSDWEHEQRGFEIIPTFGTEGISFPVDGILANQVEKELSELLRNLPVKVWYNSNFVTMFVSFNQTKTVTIQSVLYYNNDIKEVVLANPEWVNKISKLAIEESKKETLND